MNPTTTINVGDVVKRREDNGNNVGYPVGTAPFSVQSFDGRYAIDIHGDKHAPESLELVTAATPAVEPRPFQVGDIVRRGIFGSNYTITRIDPNGNRPQHYGGAGGWDYSNNITLVTPVAVAPAAPHVWVAGDQFRRTVEGNGRRQPNHRVDGRVLTVRRPQHSNTGVHDTDGTAHLNENIEFVAPAPAVPATPRPFQVGDVVTGSMGEPRTIQSFEPHATRASVRTARYTNGSADPEDRLTLIAAAPEVPRPIRVGDTVRRMVGGGPAFVVQDIRQSGGMRRAPVAVAPNGATEYISELAVTVPASTAAERKLGATPEGDNIAIDDPRIAWIWADLGTYATGKDWCREYESLAAVLGIPGRKQKFSGNITIAGQRIAFTDIEADSADDARGIFRTRLTAELGAA